MTCFYPIKAWQLEGGDIVFVERGAIKRPLSLPCGRCRGCRWVRARGWAIRCMHEARMHDDNSFVTLTYNDDHYKPSLDYRDFQLFMKRLREVRQRAKLRAVRFFVCGEYGDLLRRPHFHALLFGVSFRNEGMIGSNIWRNSLLEKLWTFGFSSVGEVTYQSAGYVARYAQKKVTGDRAKKHYEAVDVDTGEVVDLVPEFGHMSLKPGIGYTWFQKYWRDVYAARDGVVVNGRVTPPPKYYDRLLAESAPSLADEKEYDRYVNSKRFAEDCTEERLKVREICAKARDERLKRRLV